jgi:cystathionine beta-lyase
MWVADMDFKCADPILEALHRRVDHGVFGYAVPTGGATEAVVGWLKSRYNWQVQPEWIVWVPGLVSAIYALCRGFVERDENVLTFSPIYPPFMTAPVQSRRKLLKCPLSFRNGRYMMDMDRLTQTVTADTRLLLLCSPHNPVGQVWGRDELRQIAEFCLERRIVLCSDEIHCDLILDTPLKHVPTATLSTEIAANTITLMSPAKTFNIPGLNCGFAIISEPHLRSTFIKAAYDAIPRINALGYVACEAALTQGTPWLEAVLAYLRTNRDILDRAINEEIDGLSMGHVEATYLAWIDARPLNVPDTGAFFEQAGIRVINGAAFDLPGFVRINFACSREHLLLAIDRIKNSVKQLRA